MLFVNSVSRSISDSWLKTCLPAEAVLVHVTILIWVLTPGNLADVIFTTDYVVYLSEINVLIELQNISDTASTYLGHHDDLVAG